MFTWKLIESLVDFIAMEFKAKMKLSLSCLRTLITKKIMILTMEMKTMITTRREIRTQTIRRKKEFSNSLILKEKEH
jgi:hypothetical protein